MLCQEQEQFRVPGPVYLQSPKGLQPPLFWQGKQKAAGRDFSNHLDCCWYVGTANPIQPSERKSSLPLV